MFGNDEARMTNAEEMTKLENGIGENLRQSVDEKPACPLVSASSVVQKTQSGAESPHSVKERGSHGAFTLQSASRASGVICVIRLPRRSVARRRVVSLP